jgi:hypothetical protein
LFFSLFAETEKLFILFLSMDYGGSDNFGQSPRRSIAEVIFPVFASPQKASCQFLSFSSGWDDSI